MIPRKLTIHGITRYTEPVTLDLSDAPPGLIALVGGNGQGKTTLLECLAPAPVYLDFPSYPGRLADVAAEHVRDATIDLELEHAGHVWRHLVQIDPLHGGGRGKVEAYLYRDGVPVTEAGRQADYRQAVANVYPARSVFLAAAYSSQIGTGNWFALDTAGRRALFADLLGLGDLAAIAERSNRHRRHCIDLLARLDERAAPVAFRAEQIDGYRNERALLHGQLQIDERHESGSAAALQSMIAEQERADRLHAAAEQRWRDLRREAEDAIVRAGEAAARLQRLEAEQAGDLATAATGATLADDLARLDALTTEADDLAGELLTMRAAQRARDDAYLEAIEAARRAERAATLAAADLREFSTLPAAIAEAEQAAADVAKLDAEIAEIDAVRDANAAGDASGARGHEGNLARQLQRAHENKRAADKAAAMLDAVPCGGARIRVNDDPDQDVRCDGCDFIADARQAADAMPHLVTEIESATRLHARAEAALRDAEARESAQRDRMQRRTRLEADAAAKRQVSRRLGQLRERMAERAEAEAADAAARDHVSAAAAALRASKHAREQGRALLAEAEAERAAVASQIADLLPSRDLQHSIALAQERVKVRAEQIEDARSLAEAAQRAANQATAATPARPIASTDERLPRLRARAAECKSAADGTRARLSALQGSINALGDPAGDLAAIEAQRATVSARLAGWRVLERSFGRDGVPALEIDAAGPEVSTLINELIAEVFGRRFSAKLRTVRPAGKGKKQREVFDLQVLDGARGGRARPASRFSVGERAILSEALKLALAIFVNRRQAHPIRTLWRDECDGALEESLATAYPTMLRRALDLGGYRNAYLISHRRAVWEQADARINVADGGATLEIP